MKSIFFVFVFKIFFAVSIFCDEGLYFILLSEEKYEELKRLGLKLSLREIYNTDSISLKDAVVLFGRGCTGSFISNQGLLLTNYHCAYDIIQKHSSLEKNYLENGFWAKSLSEELPCPGLTISILSEIEDITDDVLNDLPDYIPEKERENIISNRIKKILNAKETSPFIKYDIKSFYHDNFYLLMKYIVFKDVRLVGAPPASIGKFGGDTDNWVWPRHTGDFALFRVYSNHKNEPTNYSPENIPYKPKKYFKINAKGVKENDLTIVLGYPAKTNVFAPSYHIDHVLKTNPVKIKLRELRLNIIQNAMDTNNIIKIKYASKQATIANAWKKWIGEVHGLKRHKVLYQKKDFEKIFDTWANISFENMEKYGTILQDFENIYKKFTPLELSYIYISEGIFGIEIISKMNQFEEIIYKPNTEVIPTLKKVCQNLLAFYNNYSPIIDKHVFIDIMNYLTQNSNVLDSLKYLMKLKKKYKTWESCADELYNKSFLISYDKLKTLENYNPKKIKKIISNDEFYRIYKEAKMFYEKNFKNEYNLFSVKMDSLYRNFMKALFEFSQNIKYPDANHTLRLSYGKIKGYYPRDGVYYNWYTTIEGIFEKEDTTVLDYKVDKKFKEVYFKKDFGDYFRGDTLIVCFIANNHTSGGSSGSPVLNAYGELIGLNFDRTWESTMSDYYYNPDICRNISVDIRYILFIIDKFADAKNIIAELEIIK